jgi:tetratricopeptide (TPR) repeat protein
MTAPDPKTPGGHAPFPSALQKSAAQQGRPLHICIASPEFIGPAQQGSTGIAYTAMAQALAAAGHQVTCLLLGGKDPSTAAWQRWVEKYKQDGLTLVSLPQINASELVAPPNLIKSYETYHWLKKNDRFDIIHFPERQGPGYHTLTAKHHGLAFGRTTICVGLHNMTAWLKAADEKPVNDLAEVDTEFMERRAVALADAVVSPSNNLLDWISGRHSEMPKPGSASPTEAVRIAIQALSIDPTNAVALKALARIYLNAGLHEAAQEACQLILKRKPQDAEALQMSEEAAIQEAKLEENLPAAKQPHAPALLQTFAAGFTPPFAYP